MLEAVRRKEIGSNEEEETEIMESTICKDCTEKDVEKREENHFEEAENADENASNDEVSYFINSFPYVHFVMRACQICTLLSPANHVYQ